MAAPVAQVQIKYNEIPDESILIKSLKPFGPKETARYRVYGSMRPEHPGKLFGRTTALPTIDTIMDPETGKTYDIAFVEGVGVGGVPQVGEIMFDDTSHFMITLHGNSALDRRKQRYIELCNFLKENPHRDAANKAVLIERVDEIEDLKFKRNKRKKIQNALNVVESMTDSEILNFIRANRMRDIGSAETRRASLEDLAEKSPEKFETMPTIDYTSLFTTIDDAKAKKIIAWNNVTREWTRYTGELILAVKKGVGVSQKDELAQFLMKEDNKKDLSWIKAEIDKK